MSFLSEEDRRRIAIAVRKAEQRTAGEFVTVIARRADTYLVIPILIAAAVALALPGVLWLFNLAHGFAELYALQLGAFIVLALLLSWQRVAVGLVPDRVKTERVTRRAREQFLMRGLHRTRDRAGVLLFVAVAEHRVELIADEGINARVPPGTWDAVVAGFTAAVREGRIADGFTTAIESVADILAAHFPRAAADVNELPDRLVELD
ncbi:MAG TPA: TPM domain-containing protein [Alphaproteobacteria bacterium]|nr:TPM domain-containing protein [Alphaproteobacteria bacterium]